MDRMSYVVSRECRVPLLTFLLRSGRSIGAVATMHVNTGVQLVTPCELLMAARWQGMVCERLLASVHHPARWCGSSQDDQLLYAQ